MLSIHWLNLLKASLKVRMLTLMVLGAGLGAGSSEKLTTSGALPGAKHSRTCSSRAGTISWRLDGTIW